MGQNKSPQHLAKILSFILERRPDEFGLILDENGYVKIKELLKAFSEEEGLRYVRIAHIKEILLTVPDLPFEIDDNRIRSIHRDQLPKREFSAEPPKLLYCCVRTKAYPFVSERGLQSSAHSPIILSSNLEMADRLGKRIDPNPVMLIVQVQKSIDEGVVFYQAGETLFTADFIPAGCFTGPPLPKEKVETKKKEVPAENPSKTLPGSFVLDLNRFTEDKPAVIRERKKKEMTRDKEKKERRKQKQNMWG